jgi:hypothetical protein
MFVKKERRADRPATLRDSGLSASNQLTETNKEKQMNNEVTITGKIKNVRTFTGSKGTMVTGWFDQREVSAFSNGNADRQVYVCGMNIVALDDSTVGEILGVTRAGQEQSDLVTLKGRLVTRFDRRQDIAEASRRAPQLQLEVFEVVKN